MVNKADQEPFTSIGMGEVKDTYDILRDLYDWITRGKRRKKLDFSKALKAIASLLDAAREKLDKKQVPRRESYELVELINHADALAAAFKEEHEALAGLFEQQLPKIGRLMRDADFFIDKRKRYSLHSSFDTKSPEFTFFAEPAIRKACEEMERAAGTISAYSLKYEQEARK